ncbi:MAG: response regulator, partial [Sandaracinaceae bacterium]
MSERTPPRGGTGRAYAFEVLLGQSDVLVLLLDRDGRIEDCSSAFGDAVGSDRRLLRGCTLDGLIDVGQPPAPGALDRLIHDAPQAIELALSTRGAARWMELRSSTLPDGGVLVTLRETDRRRSVGQHETLTRALGDRFPGVLWTTDRELRVTAILGGGLALQNRTRASMMGRSILELLGTKDPSAPGVRAHLDALDGKSARYEQEIAGRRFGVRVDPLPVGDAVVGLAAIAIEMGETGELAERLRGAEREQTLGRLAGSMAHEFNNLLTVIAAHAALLADPGSTETRSEDLAAIQEATNKGRLLTSRLLSLTERQIRQPRRVRLDEVVSQLEPMVRTMVGERRRLVLRPCSTPLWIQIDPGLFEQAILSVVDNAREATDEDGRITLGCELCLDEVDGAQWVEVRVSDDGVGMTESVRARATEAFFTTRASGQGTGLGLSNALAVLRSAGGTLHIESRLGEGTTVVMRIPRVRAPSGTHAVHVESATETVLLVEDQLGVRRATRRILRRAGYQVFEASQGEDALALATTFPGTIHVLVTDVVMPGLSGPQLAQTLLAQRPELRVLYMSGYAENVEEVRAALERGQTFLAKPFAPEELLRAVREALGEGAEEEEDATEDQKKAARSGVRAR